MTAAVNTTTHFVFSWSFIALWSFRNNDFSTLAMYDSMLRSSWFCNTRGAGIVLTRLDSVSVAVAVPGGDVLFDLSCHPFMSNRFAVHSLSDSCISGS